MSEFCIAELKEGQSGGFSPRGAVKSLWKTRDFETIVSGPAETGKTWGCLQYADALCWKYPGAQGIMARKIYSTLVGTAVRTYLRIIGPNSPIATYGGEQPRWFDYPNGSRIWLAGLDNPGNALSSERDFIYINQAEELAVADFETLTTRATGRGAVMPYTRVFGDANPGPPSHWIKQREAGQKLKLLESRHVDNPTLYDESGEITAQGRRSLAILDDLTGVRRLRLRDGKWAQAEGAVYESFDAAIHVIDAMPDGWRAWRKIRSIDFGYTNPFVCQWWAIDGDDRMYLYRELYRTKILVDQGIAQQIVEKSEGEKYEITVADHDGQYRLRLNQCGIATKPAYKLIEPGIQAVAGRLKVQPDKMARLYFLRSALLERDRALEEQKLPIGTVEEFDAYLWPKGQDGKPVKEVPIDKDNHGMDAMRYAAAYIDRISGRITLSSGAPPVAASMPPQSRSPLQYR